MAIALAYAAATVLMTWPLTNYSSLDTASYPGDARLIIWTLAWDNHATLNRLPLFESNIFFPAPDSLSYNEHLFSISLFTLPLYAVTRNPVLAYNVVWLLSFIMNGVATHVWLKRAVRDDLAAFAGSLVFTFSFYKMLHGHGHLQQIWTWLLPVSALCLQRWTMHPGFGRALTWALAVVLQALSSWYLAVIAGLVQAFFLADALWVAARERRLVRAWQLTAAAVIGAAVVWPFARHYSGLALTDPREAAAYSADLAGYLVPPENTWLGQAWLARGGSGPRWIWGEQTLYLGWVALLLSAAGGYDIVKRHQWRAGAVFGGLLLAGFTLSLGPSSEPGQTWTPYGLFSSLPAVGSFRAPARFAVIVLMGLAFFTAHGARRIIATGSAGRVILLALVPVMLSEYFVVGFPGGKPQPFQVPAIYRADALTATRALVSLPDYHGKPEWFFEPDYLYYSTAHWKPIANGYGRAAPPNHFVLLVQLNTFPSPEAAHAMRRAGIEHVVLHPARHQGSVSELVQAARASADFQLVARVGPDYLFKVVPAP